jgi:hypothetical protein
MATADEVPLKNRIAASFQQLAEGATRLNKASDDLTDAIGPLDAAFKALNLGITAWHEYARDEDDLGEFWSQYVGYAKVDGKWGLAISAVSGNRNESPEEHDDKEWLFNDAPRAMRIEAIGHIPMLLDALVSQVNATASDLEAKTAIARDVADTINSLTRKQQVTK